MNFIDCIGKTIESIKLTQDNYNCVTTGIKIIFTDNTYMTINAEIGRIDNELKKYLSIS